MNENNFNTGNLDFEKMNATLADPKFANWYYNQILNNESLNLTMEEFVNIVRNQNNDSIQ